MIGTGITELEDWASDRLYTHVDVQLDWKDRVRLLVQGKFSLLVWTSVEHEPGRCVSGSRIDAHHWRWPWDKRMQLGTVEVTGEIASLPPGIA